MANPIYDLMCGTRKAPADRIAQVYNQARAMVRGNPEAMVRSLVSSGQMSQAQLDSLGREATRLMQQMPGVFK